MNPRAITYRKLNDIPHNLGTAVNVQSDGVRQHGRQLGHGRRLHPQPLERREGVLRRVPAERAGRGRGRRASAPRTRSPTSRRCMPAAYKQLREITTRLERHYKDVQDFEFTIQENTLYMLQTRNGKRTGLAAVQHRGGHVRGGAHHEEGGPAEGRAAGARPAPAPDLRPQGAQERAESRPRACPASPGAATGAVVFTADDAVAWAQKGKRVAPRPDGDGARRHPRHVASRRAS